MELSEKAYEVVRRLRAVELPNKTADKLVELMREVTREEILSALHLYNLSRIKAGDMAVANVEAAKALREERDALKARVAELETEHATCLGEEGYEARCNVVDCVRHEHSALQIRVAEGRIAMGRVAELETLNANQAERIGNDDRTIRESAAHAGRLEAAIRENHRGKPGVAQAIIENAEVDRGLGGEQPEPPESDEQDDARDVPTAVIETRAGRFAWPARQAVVLRGGTPCRLVNHRADTAVELQPIAPPIDCVWCEGCKAVLDLSVDYGEKGHGWEMDPESVWLCPKCQEQPDPVTKFDRIVAGLLLIRDNGTEPTMRAEHDELYAGVDKATMTDANKATMDAWGWIWDEAYECWMTFT